MGLLSLLNNVEGKRGSIDSCLLKHRDVVVLVDNSTRMLRKGRWDEVRCPCRLRVCFPTNDAPGELGNRKTRGKSLQT